MEYEDIEYEVKDGVATLELNRPSHLNAFTAGMVGEVLSAIDTPFLKSCRRSMRRTVTTR